MLNLIVGSTLLILAFIGVIFGIYFLIRSNRVYDLRIKILYIDMKVYDSLPSYDKMLWSFKSLNLKNWLSK
jgi:hypothetical protein